MWCRRCSRNTCFLWTRMVRACLAVAWSRRGGSGFRATLRVLRRAWRCPRRGVSDVLGTLCILRRACRSPRRGGSGLLATLCVLRRDCCDLLADCIYDCLLPRLLDAVPEPNQALVCAGCKTTDQCQRHARVAALRAILCAQSLLLPSRKFGLRPSFRATAALPLVPQLRGALSAAPSLNMSGLPRCHPEVGLWLRDTAFGAWLLHFACQTHAIKAALPLSMLFRKICFCVPPLADIALPRRPSSCVALQAFATYAVAIVPSPLACREAGAGLLFCACTACSFFTIFCQ